MSTLIQRSFSGGELAPALYSRVDTVKYATGARALRNFLVMRHGGATNRPGAEFIAEVKDSSAGAYFIPFVFNSSQTYVLEFGALYMRVHRNGAQVVESTKTITGISNAASCVITSTAHAYSNGQEVVIAGVSGTNAHYLNGRNFKVSGVTANTFIISTMDGTALNSTSLGALSGGTAARVYEIVSPYALADLSNVRFVQSADVITLVHPSYAPRELSRTGHTSWSFATITFAPSISAPTNVVNNSAGPGVDALWVVTAVKAESYEESVASAQTTSAFVPSSGAPITVSWTAVSGAVEYNVYRSKNGIFGYIGTSVNTSHVDFGVDADTTDTPPTARNPFPSADNYPSCVGYIQQRRCFASTNNDPEKIWGSRTGQFENFTTSSPIQDDDAVTFSLVGRQVNQIMHLLDLAKFVAFTSTGEWSIEGDQAGILRPGEVNPKQQTYNGSSQLAPLFVEGTALYVQARQSIVRDLAFEVQVDGYRGNDLTIFSAHLFDGHQIVSWAYQQNPHSIVWAVRDDGVLLGLTYVKNQQIAGWHRHDFGGEVEQVCVVPEGNEDAVYVLVKRTIDGRTTRYIERMTNRLVSEISDLVLMDSSLTYDGRNTNGSHTMTLSGGTDWDHEETLTLTSSTAYFASTFVGNSIYLTGADGTLIRFRITVYTDSTHVNGKAQKLVPVSMRSAAISDWARAVTQITNLWHLEGEQVSVFGDGFVVGSPNNDSYETLTVTNGTLTLDSAYTVIHAGLPITADLELLDIDSTSAETLSDKKKLVTKVTLHVESSRGIFVGGKPPTDDDEDPLEGLFEVKIRNTETYEQPVALITDHVEVNIQPQWNSNGRVFIRQVDPLPLSILSVAPDGIFPFRSGGK